VQRTTLAEFHRTGTAGHECIYLVGRGRDGDNRVDLLEWSRGEVRPAISFTSRVWIAALEVTCSEGAGAER